MSRIHTGYDFSCGKESVPEFNESSVDDVMDCDEGGIDLGGVSALSPVPNDVTFFFDSTLSLQSRNMGLLLLKLETDFSVPVSTVQFIVEQLKTVEGDIAQAKANEITKYLLSIDVRPDHIAEVVKIVECGQVIGKSFSTDYRRKLFYKSNFGYVEPVEVCINKDNGTFFHYIPICETLKNVVEWYGSILNFDKHENKSGLLFSYRDGFVYKSNEFFSFWWKARSDILSGRC